MIDITIRQRLNLINDIPDINRGGCAHVALNLYEYLKSLGYESTIVYLFRAYDEEEHHMAIGQETLVTCAHAIVKIDDDIYVDSMMIGTLREFSFTYGASLSTEVSPEYVKKTLNLQWGWNRAFYKGKYVPVIQRILRPTQTNKKDS